MKPGVERMWSMLELHAALVREVVLGAEGPQAERHVVEA
jgi:hypothetical protein